MILKLYYYYHKFIKNLADNINNKDNKLQKKYS